jgi:hypothetical protein
MEMLLNCFSHALESPMTLLLCADAAAVPGCHILCSQCDYSPLQSPEAPAQRLYASMSRLLNELVQRFEILGTTARTRLRQKYTCLIKLHITKNRQLRQNPLAVLEDDRSAWDRNNEGCSKQA